MVSKKEYAQLSSRAYAATKQGGLRNGLLMEAYLAWGCSIQHSRLSKEP